MGGSLANAAYQALKKVEHVKPVDSLTAPLDQRRTKNATKNDLLVAYESAAPGVPFKLILTYEYQKGGGGKDHGSVADDKLTDDLVYGNRIKKRK